MSEQKMREALELADAALSGANMNMNVVMRKVKEALAQDPAAMVKCMWSCDDDEHMPGTWNGGCGAIWTFTDGGPIENYMRFCPQCGGRVLIRASQPEVKS